VRNFTSASISPHFILIYWSIDYCLTSRKQYFSYIQQLGRDEKFSLLQWPHCAYSLSKSTKEVFSVQGELPSPNMLATMVWKPDTPPSLSLSHWEGSSYLPSVDLLSSSVGLSPGILPQYPVFSLNLLQLIAYSNYTHLTELTYRLIRTRRFHFRRNVK
jgi:hypothetical protein